MNEEENEKAQEKEHDGDGGMLIPSYLQHIRDARRVGAWQRHLPRMYSHSHSWPQVGVPY